MLKIDEKNDPKSCWNKADDHERLFVLLARDVAAPLTILCWIMLRVVMGKNKLNDPQLKEAWDCARLMETYGKPKTEPHPSDKVHCNICNRPDCDNPNGKH